MLKNCVLLLASVVAVSAGPVTGEVLVYRAEASFVSNSITSGPLAGLSGPIVVEIGVDVDAEPSGADATLIQWLEGSGRVVSAEASVGAFRVPLVVSSGVEQVFDAWSVVPGTYADEFRVLADDDTAFRVSASFRINMALYSPGPDATTATDWRLPACGVGPIDPSPFVDRRSVQIYGPDAVTEIVGFITAFEIVRPEPCVGDVTTTGTNPGDPGYGDPDGIVDGADLSYFVEFWVGGCP